jgi:RNA-directed DNA polymerase
MPDLIIDIASDTNLNQTLQWLCKRRKNLSHNNDVWELRRHWQRIKQELQQTLLQGKYKFSPLGERRFPDSRLQCWCATDSLVLKAMAIVLDGYLARLELH